MKKKLMTTAFTLTALISLVACSNPNSNENTDFTKEVTESAKKEESEDKEKEYVYTDIPDDFNSRLEWVETETKKIPESETLPFDTGNSLEMFRQLNPEKWTEVFPKTLMVVLTVKGCKRCDDYEEMIVQKAQAERDLINQSVGNNKAILTRYELSEDKDESEKELTEIASRLGVDGAIFNESRPVILSFAYLKENGTSQYKWVNTFKAVPKEDGKDISSSVGEDYMNKMSEVYNEAF